jgi:hypothetical protein
LLVVSLSGLRFIVLIPDLFFRIIKILFDRTYPVSIGHIRTEARHIRSLRFNLFKLSEFYV